MNENPTESFHLTMTSEEARMLALEGTKNLATGNVSPRFTKQRKGDLR
jgi:hypothetical protein